MDEYEVGEVVLIEGRNYRYLGGDVTDKSNWEPVRDAAERQEGVVGALQRAGQGVADVARRVPDFLKVAGQEATARFGDEIAGIRASMREGSILPNIDLNVDPAAQASAQESIAGSRERIGPVGNVVAMLAPAAVPYGIGARAIGAGRGLLGTAARGGAAGAAEGGLFALGGAEGSAAERIRQVDPVGDIVVPGAAGGAGAVILPRAINALQRGRAGRGARVGGVIQEQGQVDEGLADVTRRLGQRQVGSTQVPVRGTQPEAISAHFYRPLEEEFTEITDPGLRRMLQSEEVLSNSRVARQLADSGEPPSFEQVQRIRDNLRRANQTASQERMLDDLLDEFNEVGYKAVPGWREADQAFSVVKGQQEALERGRRFWNKNSSDLEVTLEQIAKRYDDPAEAAAAQDAFRTGMFGEWLVRLMERDESSGTILRKIMDAGPEFRRIEEQLFPTNEGLLAFRKAVNEEKSADAVRSVVQKWGRWFIPALITGSAGYALGRGLGGN